MNINNKSCCGCSACVEICPCDALELKYNENGFLFSFLDPVKCVSCGKCIKVCPLLNKKIDQNYFQDVMLFKDFDEQEYKRSSSGGASTVINRKFFDDGAAVYGVCYTKEMDVEASRALTKNDLKLYVGSKYVQANYLHTFSSVLNDLESGLKVIFTATPCVIAGLRLYLDEKKVDISNLFLIDLICHGVGSRDVFKKYIWFLSQKYKKNIIDFKFRGKTELNSHTHHSKIQFDDGAVVFDSHLSKLYQNLYFKNLIMNEECFNCKFACGYRVGDISIGDNSGYFPQNDDQVDFRQTSLVLVNTDKGKLLCSTLSKFGYMKKISIEDVKQPHLYHSNVKPEEYEKFWTSYHKLDFTSCLRRYGGYNFISYLKMKRNKII